MLDLRKIANAQRDKDILHKNEKWYICPLVIMVFFNSFGHVAYTTPIVDHDTSYRPCDNHSPPRYSDTE